MLSETRKYQLFCVMAHQNWSQASARLQGALQNVGLEVILKTGRADAEYSARLLGAVDPLSVKHTVADEVAVERTHPTFFPLSEQWESYTQAIQQLHCGQAFIRLPDDTVRRVATPTLPAVSVPAIRLHAIRQHYLHAYFRPLPPSHQTDTPPAASGASSAGQAKPQPVAPAPLSGSPAAPDGTSNVPVAFDCDVAPAPAQAPGTGAVESESSQTQPEQPISRQRPDEPTG